MNQWPKHSECSAFYGNPMNPRDHSKHSLLWEVANLVYVKAPFTMTYAGAPMKRGFRIHKKCAASMQRILENLWTLSGQSQKTIDSWGVSVFGGSFAYRLKRGGSTLSMHSWGCAIDLDPARNAMNARKPHFATLPQVVKVFTDEGWTQLKNDQMHFQAANL